MQALGLAFAPFIHFARDVVAADLRPEVTARRVRYELWLATSGSLELVGAAGRHAVPRGGAALLPPRSGMRPALAPSAGAVQIVFDVVSQARRPCREGPGWHAADSTLQPDPRTLWGVDIPIPLPPGRCGPARACAAAVARTWWLSPLEHLRANLRLADWLLDLVETLAGDLPEASADDPLRRAELYARRALAGPCTVADLAAVAGMARTRFSEAFERRHGRPPGAWLDDLRMALALRLLRDPALPVARVARAVGYRKAEAFVRRFRAAFGEHPARRR